MPADASRADAAAGDDTLRNRIEPMEEEGAVGELEEEEGVERSRLVWARWALSCLTQRRRWRCSGNLT